MNSKDRRATATATFGLAGVGSAAALRHTALERAYAHGKRPPVLQELKMLRNGTKGRSLYATGMGLGAVATPAAVSGVSSLLNRKKPVAKSQKRRSFLAEGAEGVRNSIRESSNTVKEPPPARLALANYLGGGAVTALTGAGINHKLKGTKLPGAAKAGIAAMGAVTGGAATLPVQSKVMNRFSGGQYETTAHGVRRKKTKAVRPSTQATTVNANGVPTPVGKGQLMMAGRKPAGKVFRSTTKGPHGRLIEEHHNAMWDAQTRNLPSVAQAHQGFIRELESLPTARSRKRALAAGGAVGTGGVVAGSQVKKYYGQDMTHAQKRARVAAVTGLPVVSDVAQAGLASRMAPPELRKKTAAQVYGGGQVGGAVGTAAGAYGAAALARRSKEFERGTTKVNDALDSAKNSVRSAVGLKPRNGKPSVTERLHASGKTPKLVKRAVKPLIGHGKVAAVGGLALGGVGGIAGSQTGYGFALRAEDRHKKKIARSSQSARHGSRVTKGAPPEVESKRAQAKLRRSKEQSAVMSQAGGAIGLTALGATLGSKVKALGPKNTKRLAKLPMPMLTGGAGLSGVNAFKYADIQHKEAAAKVKKGLVPIRRVPRAVRGSLRQTRTASTGAIRTSYTRGGVR